MHKVESVKSVGQKTLEALAAWLSGYLSLGDPGYATVLALWAMHTWVIEHLGITAYLCITGRSAGCGKSRMIDLLKLVSRNGKAVADTTGPTMLRMIGAFDGKLTMFLDEYEKYSGSALGVVRSLTNTGYRAGQMASRTTKEGYVEMPVFCAKAFALIGDLNDTLKSRTIPILLERGTPTRDYFAHQAESEAASLVKMIEVSFTSVPTPVYVPWLQDREREIWSAMYGTAASLKLDDATMAEIRRVSGDLIGLKSAPPRHYTQNTNVDETFRRFGERALLDFASVCKASSEPFVWSAVAIERMKGIEASPWRTFQGVGLTERSLAELVRTFGVRTGTATMVRGKGARLAPKAKGYYADSVVAVAKALKEGAK